MGTWAETIPSQYIKKEEIDRPRVLTIREVVPSVVMDKKTDERKPVVYFHGATKGLPLNITNITTMETLFGEDRDACIGQKVEIYVDENVMYMGERKPGIRLRAPQGQAAQAPTQPPTPPTPPTPPGQPDEPPEDDIPF